MKMNISKLVNIDIEDDEEEIKVCAPGHVPCKPTRLTEEEAQERGWAVPTQFNAKGMRIIKLEVCTESWVIEMVWHKFQHWPTTECPGEVSKFVKDNKSKILALLDWEGTPETFCGDQKWHLKATWNVLAHVTKKDLELAKNYQLRQMVNTGVHQSRSKKLSI